MTNPDNLLKVCPRCGTKTQKRTKVCKMCSHVFIHDRPPVVDPNAPTDAYVATRDFSHSLGGTTVQFKAQMPIIDREIIRQLLEVEAPIEPLDPSVKMATCPNCACRFALPGERTQ